MPSERETLKFLRQSLDEEDDDASILPILENHHKYLKEYVFLLESRDTTPQEKQEVALLFFTIFEMHARAEEKSLYRTLNISTNQYVRLEGLKNFDEHEIAHELIAELRHMDCTNAWSEDIEAKMRVLTGLITHHLKEEEKTMFPIADRFVTEELLMDLADDYLEHCRIYLDTQMRELHSEVSRSDVMTFLN
jgi:hemerythrin superfamily protein